MRAAGVDLLSINTFDDAAAIRKLLEKERLSFIFALNGAGQNDVRERLGLSLYPTNYVIDSEGKVVDAIAGPDMKRLRLALEKIGVKFSDETTNSKSSRH